MSVMLSQGYCGQILLILWFVDGVIPKAGHAYCQGLFFECTARQEANDHFKLEGSLKAVGGALAAGTHPGRRAP